MGLKDLTQNQWRRRLELRGSQLAERWMHLEGYEHARKEKGITSDLCLDVLSLSVPIPPQMRDYLEAAAETQYEAMISGIVNNPTDRIRSDLFSNLLLVHVGRGTLFGAAQQPFLLQNYFLRQEQLQSLRGDSNKGPLELVLSIVSQEGIEKVEFEGPLSGAKYPIFCYVPRPARIIAKVAVDLDTGLVTIPTVDVGVSRMATSDLHFKGAMDTTRAQKFEQILSLEVTDPFNLYVIKSIVTDLDCLRLFQPYRT